MENDAALLSIQVGSPMWQVRCVPQFFVRVVASFAIITITSGTLNAQRLDSALSRYHRLHLPYRTSGGFIEVDHNAQRSMQGLNTPLAVNVLIPVSIQTLNPAKEAE